MKMLRKQLVTLAAAATLAMPLSVLATNGMNPEGTGVKNRGMGGAGVAMANESASVTNNPAAAVNAGDRWDVALGMFSPKPRGYTLTDNNFGAGSGPNDPNFNNSQESGSNEFFIPFFGMVSPIDDKSAWAFVVNANGGMNSDYATNFGSRLGVLPPFAAADLSGSTGINLAQLFINGTYARKVTDTVSLGVTAIYAYQTFEAKGLGAFGGATIDPNNLTDNGEDTSSGFGFKLGVQANIGNGMTLGAAYQSKIEMEKFSKYRGLFADQGSLDIAPTYSVGLAWVVDPQLIIAFDYLYIDYEAVDSISNSTSLYDDIAFDGCSEAQGDTCFGSSGGPGFGWKSINVFKLGAQYAMDSTWTLRAGWNHGDNPIGSDEVSVNFLAPGVIEDHLTLGFTNNLTKDSELSFNFVHSFENSVSGPFSQSFGGGTMNISMEQNFFEFGYASHF